ncbi:MULTISPECIES: hypothetical protein [Paenibacillus]|uniref:hypothetical protein n=1 Tax=Paenibacillus TaxID=44249 RepID=UPI00096F5AFA|nr:hypothetical protein [Paenibacillus odorifer]OME56490.1 hypothetical protein BSK59_11485 [Paenibacillus odorifer]OME61879.1 hypothetical protein BSK61_02125 [Paenibacillus odorifer]
MQAFNNYIDELERITIDVVNNINTVTYQQLEEFSEERFQLIKLLERYKEELPWEAKQRLSKLNAYDATIIHKMNILKLDASDWLLKQGTIKEQKTAYGSSYVSESILFDRKN